MSGIAAVVAPRGAPAARSLLERMAGALAFRAPDGAAVHAEGEAGLVHALLRTSPEQVAGPRTLGGSLWIAADARIDAREALVDALAAAGERVAAGAPDAALVLHAYRAWGTACPERLLGDFAFALWDAERRRLFCARDPFGVKLLYHASAAGSVGVSNTLDVLRLLPGVSDRPDDLAVADYLLFGWIQDADRTAFAGVRALPPAHAMTVEEGRISAWRYWTPPVDGDLRLRGAAEYAERFREVLAAAVADRTREGRAAVMMSGGRDSTAVAAAAVDAGRRPGLRAFTMVYERLMPDREGEFARLAAGALGIPVELHPVDGYRVLGRWDDPALARPEPSDAMVMGAGEADFHRRLLGHAPVGLTGHGADPLLTETPSRLVELAVRGRLLAALGEAAAYVRWHRRLPRPGLRTWRRHRRGERWTPPYPEWITPEAEARLDLRARWEKLNAPPPSDHPRRPRAHGQLAGSLGARILELYDPGVSRVPIEYRHPFLDRRVVETVLAIPPVQWYNDKGLLRIAYRDTFPPAFHRRQKTPLATGSVAARIGAYGAADVARRRLSPGIGRWVDPRRVPRLGGGEADDPPPEDAWLHLRPLIVSIWLERSAWSDP